MRAKQFLCFDNSNHLAEEDRVGCFTLIVCLMSCDCYFYVALSPGDVVWSAVW